MFKHRPYAYLPLLSILLSNVAFSATYTFDSRRADCVDSKGNIGRNPALGICGDQSGQDLSHRNLTGMNLLGTDLSYASLSQAQLNRVDLSYARLDGASLDQVTLREAKLMGARGQNCNLDSSDLNSADLRQSQLTFASLKETNLTAALLLNANLQDSNFTDANLKDVLARQAAFNRVDFLRTQAERADFSSSQFKSAQIQNAYLRYANFRDADLSQARILNTDLTGTDLRGAGLLGSDFTGSNLKDAILQGARFDESTKIPFPKAEALALGMLWEGRKGTDLILYNGTDAGFSAGLNWDVTGSDVQAIEQNGQRLRFTLNNKSMWGAAAYIFRNYEEVDLSSYRTLSFRASSSTPVKVMFYLVNVNSGNESQSLKPFVTQASQVYTMDLQKLQADGFDLKHTHGIIVAVAEPNEKTYLIDVDDIQVTR